MRRDELERRVTEFVGELAGEPGASRAIDPDTPLFEEGLIDSLRILDLMAFVEAATGARVPDAAVRLAHFRSARAIAAAFGEDGPGWRAGRRAGPAAPLRVFERRGPRTGFARPIEELAARGEVDVTPPGRVVFRGAARRLLEGVDDQVRAWARGLGAREVRFPALLPAATLARAGRTAPEGGPDRLVPPAVCYHAYGEHADAALEAGPVLLTTRGRCFRDEADFTPSQGRLRAFEMREIVALGARAEVEAFREELLERVGDLVTALDLEGRIETANDPFFLEKGPGERGRALVQRVLPLKYELRLALDAGGRTTAVASFNHHLRFFGRRFGIRLPSGRAAHSGCVAFGLERWVLAVLARHGVDPRGWPETARELRGAEVERA